jgi:hypothetical protein
MAAFMRMHKNITGRRLPSSFAGGILTFRNIKALWKKGLFKEKYN